MATLSEIRDWVRNQTLIEEDDWADSKVDAVINQGLKIVSARFPWPFLLTFSTISTVADTQSYQLPDEYLRTHSIIESGERNRLRELSPIDAWDEYGNDFPSATSAQAFFIHGVGVYLVPIPSSVKQYTHHYYRTAETLANGTDEPEWSSEYHMVLADYAIARAWEREEDYAKAAVATQAFDQGVEEMARFYLKRAASRPMVFGQAPTDSHRGSNMPWLNGV